MFVLALAVAALAGPVDHGWTVLRTADGCTLSSGPDVVPGVPALKAHCEWAEIEPDWAFHAASDPLAQDQFLWTLTDQQLVVGGGPGPTWVKQRHEVFGIRAREGVIRHRSSSGPLGYVVEWDLEDKLSSLVAPDAVGIAHNSGRFQFAESATGGSSVDFELRFAPGGTVPHWVVRWVQVDGAIRMLSRLREVAGATPQVAGD